MCNATKVIILTSKRFVCVVYDSYENESFTSVHVTSVYRAACILSIVVVVFVVVVVHTQNYAKYAGIFNTLEKRVELFRILYHSQILSAIFIWHEPIQIYNFALLFN